MGHVRPQAHAAMCAMKAEGDWGVVSTEECKIHTNQELAAISATGCKLACTYSGQLQDITCGAVLLVMERTRHSSLYDTLKTSDAKLQTLELIDDAASHSLIAGAV